MLQPARLRAGHREGWEEVDKLQERQDPPLFLTLRYMAPDLRLAQFTDARPEPFATARAATALAAISGEPAKLTPHPSTIVGLPGFWVKFERARWAYPYVAGGGGIGSSPSWSRAAAPASSDPRFPASEGWITRTGS